MNKLLSTIERAIAALARHGFMEAADCLNIELLLFRKRSISAFRLRHTANSLLSVLA